MVNFISVAKVVVLILSVTIFFCLYRAILGPTVPDRIIGVNVIGTKVVVMFVLVSIIFEQPYFCDIALLYALLLYITTLAFVKYLEYNRLDK
jgi:multicomponent Na+:H+ antiporter subunit F